ncbi:MAG: hypothetical protein JJU41_05485 [Bacteroidetes bacterium]|nr:hypothetical protein [Bacteroidota bacterium]MCH8523743.1 DUF4412 domain-containing protein [Balneolales bacterium]
MLRSLSFFVLMMAVAMPLSAQSYFTGSFNAVYSAPDSDEATTVRVITSPERMLIAGLADVMPSAPASMPGMSAERLLLRMDQQDIVFLSDQPTALRMQTQEINAAMNLMAGMQRQVANAQQTAVDIRETSETRRINGYAARKWEVRSPDNDGLMHVWISEDFRVNWGMFASIWRMMTSNGSLSGMADLLQGGQTPLLAEAFDEEGALIFRAELTDIRQGAASGALDVPSGVRLVSLQDMILEQMRNQR